MGRAALAAERALQGGDAISSRPRSHGALATPISLLVQAPALRNTWSTARPA